MRVSGTHYAAVWGEARLWIKLVGACLAATRRRANLTQIEAAEWVGRSQTFISEIERGMRRVDVLEIILIARALGADPRQLFASIARAADVS